MIRAVVVDDSLTVRRRLSEVLGAAGDFEVVGEAADGARAIELVRALRPDVVTLDLVLPDVDGVAATEQIMAHVPTPILIVSSAANRGTVFATYEALAAGAVDVLDKPDGASASEDWDARFVAAARMVSKIKVITHPRGRLPAATARPAKIPSSPIPVIGLHEPAARGVEVIALGASTGGPSALVAVLAGMPRLPIPTVAILHIDAPFALSFANWLGGQTERPCYLAVDGQALDGPLFAARPGTVLFAPADRHLVVERRNLRLVDGPPRNFCRPSIDILFDSVARSHGKTAAACLLTGMGRDGASGLLAIRRAGGATFAQDEATSVVYGMPREALACGAVDRGHPIHELGPAMAAHVAALGGAR